MKKMCWRWQWINYHHKHEEIIYVLLFKIHTNSQAQDKTTKYVQNSNERLAKQETEQQYYSVWVFCHEFHKKNDIHPEGPEYQVIIIIIVTTREKYLIVDDDLLFVFIDYHRVFFFFSLHLFSFPVFFLFKFLFALFHLAGPGWAFNACNTFIIALSQNLNLCRSWDNR